MKNIQRLSEYLDVKKADLKKLGVHNGFVGIDSRLFIDPFLLSEITTIPEFTVARKKLETHFENVIKLLKVSASEGDIAWRQAVKMLTFKENPYLNIGYGKGTNVGNAIGPELASRLAKTAKEIISMGITDPSIFVLLGLFEEDFGSDRLSDMSAKILEKEFLSYTSRCALELGLKKTKTFKTSQTIFHLPIAKSGEPILFIPEKALKDLPVAQSFQDIGTAVAYNEGIRRRYNQLIAQLMAGQTKKPKKAEVRSFILSDNQRLETLVEAYQNGKPQTYDFDSDPAGAEKWYEASEEIVRDFPLSFIQPTSADDLFNVVKKIIEHYKQVIELHGCNILLFDDQQKPRNEKYAQSLFYATALRYCENYNIDVIRESNGGRGPVDFKFPLGYSKGTVVEMKLSSSQTLSHGYSKQLPLYQEVERGKYGILLIVKVSKNADKKIERIQEMLDKAKEDGKDTPYLISVDARIKPSASKLR